MASLQPKEQSPIEIPRKEGNFPVPEQVVKEGRDESAIIVEKQAKAIREQIAKMDSGEVSPIPKELGSKSQVTATILKSDIDKREFLADALNTNRNLMEVAEKLTGSLIEDTAKRYAEDNKN